jgi:hypothetical protein
MFIGRLAQGDLFPFRNRVGRYERAIVALVWHLKRNGTWRDRHMLVRR